MRIAIQTNITLPELHSGQKAVEAEARQTNIVCAHHGWGSTTFAVTQAFHHIIDGKNVDWFAPKNHLCTAMEIMRECVSENLQSGSWFNESHRMFQLPGRGRIQFHDIAVATTRGSTSSLVICEGMEQYQDDFFENVVRPIALKCSGTIWGFGTPQWDKPNSDFERILARANDYQSEQSWIIPARGALYLQGCISSGARISKKWSHPLFPFGSDEELYKSWEMTANKQQWLSEYLCIFPDAKPKIDHTTNAILEQVIQTLKSLQK